MKAVTVALIAGAGIALWYLSGVAVAANSIQYSIAGIAFNSLTNWTITLNVQNVADTGFTLKALSGNVTLNGGAVGSLSDFSGSVVVPPAGQVNIPIQFSLSLLSLPSTISDVISNDSGSFDIGLTGNANVNGIVLPFNTTQTYAA
jgi:hypothetical protein